ncbi:alkaline phosphatase family protein [Paenarthrobacter aurescens]|uniref:alkaline phosphatase family protein n=1 Tax=Paenarthrobacter aurescens TaxID=43663 RepID=UPI0021C0057A|nr:alkaline phosphatase family protein [Paenarthrobacter aurescens]MCT9869966.1 alkaline phosphatase family protein [Paenarthrobacter aurescens]
MDNARPFRTATATAALTLAAAVVLPSAAVAAPAAPDAPETQYASTDSRPAQAPYSGLPDGTKRKKTLVIGLDGAAIAKFSAAGVPNIQSVVDSGMTAKSNLFANPMAPTVSGAGWSSIATGVWPDKHNVVDNNFTAPNYSQYPDYLSRLESTQPKASTLVVGTWSPIPQTVFGEKVDLRLAGGNDAGTTAKAVDYLANGNPDSTFVHLDEVDGAGHSYGTEREEYLAALRRADGQVGEILNAVKNRPSYTSEDWLVVLTADHGHTPTGGHGGNTPAERQTFVIAQGKGIKAGTVRNDVKITDIAPTVLKHEGVTTDAAWNLDGKAIADIEADDFDSLRDSLRTRADETAPAADVKGWTTTAPEGWSIDNSAMPAGGVTEWRGWSFATDEFWTNTDRNQGRETSVRNRNVFAVADSDEWDDKAHAAGQFDSTLVSPDFKVKGGKTATLSFASNYRIDGPQSGEVFVSYDGGVPQLVKAYTANFNGFESLALEVPKGAKKAKVSFRYTGTNSAFWTVDQVRLDR